MQSILIDESRIQKRVQELGQQISTDYQQSRDLVLVCVLKGAAVFFADLIRAISVPLRCEFIQLASYNDGTKPSEIQVLHGLTGELSDVDVLIVEDIVDTGQSLDFLLKHINRLQPTSVKVCSLLDKPERRRVPVTIDYCGFEIPDAFVVGYGLDYGQRYRNLRDIGGLAEM
jgi:hypoxanthine phosphoribosyltransferase